MSYDEYSNNELLRRIAIAAERIADVLESETSDEDFSESAHPEPPVVYRQFTNDRVRLAFWGNENGVPAWGLMEDGGEEAQK